MRSGLWLLFSAACDDGRMVADAVAAGFAERRIKKNGAIGYRLTPTGFMEAVRRWGVSQRELQIYREGQGYEG